MQQLSNEDRDYLITFLEDAIYASQTCIEVLNYRYADQGMHKHAKALYQQVRAHCHLTGTFWPMNDSSQNDWCNLSIVHPESEEVNALVDRSGHEVSIGSTATCSVASL